MVKAIIFDFDGVLVSSELARFQALQKYARKYNIIIDHDKLRDIVGRTTRTFLDAILNEKEKNLIDNIIDDFEKGYKSNILQYVSPITQSVEFVRTYHGSLKLALASMSSMKSIETILGNFGILHKFSVIISKEQVNNHKPHPEIYLKAAQNLGVSPEECIAVEDTIIGAQSALDAGIACYILLNELNSKEEFSHSPIAGFITSQKDLEKIASL